MGWRFRKSIKIAPGVKLNLNKKSMGVTFGKKGMHHTINSSGRQTTSFGIPNTGLSYVHTSSVNNKKEKFSSRNNNIGTSKEKVKGCTKGCLSFFLAFFILIGFLGSCGNDKKEENSTTIETLTTTENVTTTEKPTTTLETTTIAIITTTEENTTITTTEVVTEASTEVTTEITTDTTTIATTEESTTEVKEKMVWICSTGKKYHKKSTCSNMESPWEVTISEAERLGYTPCKRCY